MHRMWLFSPSLRAVCSEAEVKLKAAVVVYVFIFYFSPRTLSPLVFPPRPRQNAKAVWWNH